MNGVANRIENGYAKQMNHSPTTGPGPTDDTGIQTKLGKDRKALTASMDKFNPSKLIKDFSPMDDPKVSSSPAKGSESAKDIKLDDLRGGMCSEMFTFYGARPYNDLCGGRILSKSYNFGAATTGAEDIVPFCGRQSALTCGQGQGIASSSSAGSAVAIMDCDMLSWRAACLGGAGGFNNDKLDVNYNERLYGIIPIDCYCACYEQCTMGQSNVLGAQRTGAHCTSNDLKKGRCKDRRGGPVK
jgi:hypothetical protein